MSWRVFCHPDTGVLEEALEEALKRRRRADPLAPVWIVTPTRRLRRQLQRRLAARRTHLGLRFAEPPGLVAALHRELRCPRGRRLGPVASAALARAALADLADGRRLLQFRGAAGALLPAFQDLREAGFGAPERGEPRPDSGGMKRLPQESRLLLEAFWRWRQRVLRGGMEDEFDAVENVRRALEVESRPLPPVLLFGFSELVGRWRRWIRTLARRGDVELYAHAQGTEPVPELAAAERLLAALCPAGGGIAPERLEPAPATGAGVELEARSLRGPRAELEEALRRALQWHRGGVPLEEIGVLTRSLGPYLPHLGPLAERLRLAGLLDCPGDTPLRLLPAARALLDGFQGFGDVAALAAAQGEAGNEAVAAALRRAWADARDAAALAPADHPRALLQEALDATAVRLDERQDGGGLAVLDFQQARGLRFQRVVLLGLHQGSIPRPPGDDPFLPDATRRWLSRGLPDPLPVRSDVEEEERLLLALALRTAARSLVVLRQRADEDGSAVAHSPLRPEVERYLGRRLAFADVRADPLGAAERRVRSGAATAEEACLALAAAGDALPAVGELCAASPSAAALLGPAPEWLAAVESFEPKDMRFDGAAAEGADFTARLSVTDLEGYGRQPMAYFFEHVLQVPPRAGAPRPEPDPMELGTAVHEVLCQAWGESPKSPEALQRAVLERFDARSPELFSDPKHPEWQEAFDHERARWRDALARFVAWDWRRLQEGWNRRDQKLGGPPLRVDAAWLEQRLEGELTLGGLRLGVKGRVDRLLRGDGVARISDYKTGKFSKCGEQELLRGQRLQNALYLLLLEVRGELPGMELGAEAVRIHPDADYEETTAGNGEFGSGVLPEHWKECRDGVRETAEVLARHLRAGHFPSELEFKQQNRKTWDDWYATMRLGHAPTIRRVEGFPAWRELMLLRKKGGGVFFLRDLEDGGEPEPAAAAAAPARRKRSRGGR